MYVYIYIYTYCYYGMRSPKPERIGMGLLGPNSTVMVVYEDPSGFYSP